MRSGSEALHAPDLASILLLYKVFILPAAMLSPREAVNCPMAFQGPSNPPPGVYMKDFEHAFQNASLECNTPDSLFNENGKIEVAIK